MTRSKLFLLLILSCHLISGQSTINIYPDTFVSPININLKPGVFFVPKTLTAKTAFLSNGIQQNCIRTNVIESVLNNTSNLSNCLSLLTTVKLDLQSLSSKCDKLLFIFEKMPAWLSSSSNPSPANTPGWSVLNTKPPANWNTWQTVVDSITSKIVNQFGITNAYFEIWNEPDLGSWTGSMADYFTLYKRTYDGVKSANPMAKVGGPTVNFWGNNIFWQPIYGYISNAKADSSLIGQLLDSGVVWNKVPDFISWHQFDITHQTFDNASKYIQQKLIALSLPPAEMIVSEWNAPSQIRDTKLATSFMIKTQLELAKTSISNNVIAAWQDFNPNSNEFHNDYGLITYGAIHKPAYNSILLSNQLKGDICKTTSTDPYYGTASVSADTLSIIISNYCPPPIVEALNHTLFEGQFNILQLDSAGYLKNTANGLLHLDSIYSGLLSIPNINAMQIAINNSKTVYQHYKSIYNSPRQFNLNIIGYPGNYSGQLFLIDSTKNNMQFIYDSLRAAGYTQAAAIASILPIQTINHLNISTNSGQYSISMQPNAVALLKIKIPGINNLTENDLSRSNLMVYPNPSSDNLTLSVPITSALQNDQIRIYNMMGLVVKTVDIKQVKTQFSISDLPVGLYFLQCKNNSNQIIKFSKQ